MSVQHGQVGNFKVLDLHDIAWQQVGNLQCQCSMGRLATLKCWICLTVLGRRSGSVGTCADWCSWAAFGQ